MTNERKSTQQDESGAVACVHAMRIKKGFYKRQCDSKKVQKYECKSCGKCFSDQTSRDSYRMRTVRHWAPLRKMLCSGTSRRRCARNRGLARTSVERALNVLAARASRAHETFVKTKFNGAFVQFDEMETFIHTKCKPLSIPLLVSPERHILAIGAASMPAKGRLTNIAFEKYGPRRDDRDIVMNRLLATVAPLLPRDVRILTDRKSHYVTLIRTHFPGALHAKTDGGRGCIVGYGELKKKGFDPMFALNHTAAMLRDGLATLKRRTWTTTKNPENLLKLMMIYADFHNSFLVGENPRKAA